MRADTGRVATATLAEARGRATDAERVDWLIDNADAYRAVLAAIGRARESIWITQLAFDADCVAHDTCPKGNSPRVGAPGSDTPATRGVLLFDSLIAAAARGVAVRVLLNETLLLDTVTPLRAALRRAQALDVRVRGIKRFPQLLHAKLLIVDEHEGLLLGSPFANGYWDDSNHLPVDGRRPPRELGGRPLHDVSTRVTGPAVRALGAVFAELWNDASVGDASDAPIECRPLRARDLGGHVSIARTVPDGVLPRHREGATEILNEIERALAAARRLVYVEHQYLSSRRVIAALAGALARERELEIVIVLNQNPDVTAYRGWQNARLRDAGLLDHPRVGLFALWRATPPVADSAARGWMLNQLFVHSKVLIVDDAWVTVGSANLDGVSLHSYGDDFTGWLGRRIFRDVRNFDVNVVLRAEHGAKENPVRALRTRLWSEHLTLDAATLESAPREVSLTLWRERAAMGIEMLGRAPGGGRDDRAPQVVPFVLPYSARSRPADQLRDVGVREVERLGLCFDPGWLEVHFSPNWVRNMFA